MMTMDAPSSRGVSPQSARGIIRLLRAMATPEAGRASSPASWSSVEDVVNIGDEVTVKVIEIDKMGRVNLSMRPQDLNPKGGK